MKTKIILFLSVLVLLVACKTSYPREQQSGKEDVAFYKRQVLDGGVTFTAKAVKDRKATYKGESYAVKPGARDIIVRSGNDVIYSKKLFLSPQETKQIKLP